MVLRDFAAESNVFGLMPPIASAGAAIGHPDEKDAKDENECAHRDGKDEFGRIILRPYKRSYDAGQTRQRKEYGLDYPALDDPAPKPPFGIVPSRDVSKIQSMSSVSISKPPKA